MRVHLVAVMVLIGVPAMAFVITLNRDVGLVPLDGIEAKCQICDRKATRTLQRVAAGLRAKGIYVYPRSEYPGGMPVWCDLHGPDKMRENSKMAYFAAIASFALAGTAYEKIRRSQ